MIFAEFGVIRTFGLSVRNAGVERGPSKIFGVYIRCTGALLMYAAVAIISATSSPSQTRPIFHGVR